MKQLLYVPKGEFFYFFNEHIWKKDGTISITWSIEEYLNWFHQGDEKISYTELLDHIILWEFNEDLYLRLDIPLDHELTEAEFELVDV